MTPSGLSKMPQNDREKSFVIYVDINENTRKMRLTERGDIDEIERRLRTDRVDFENFLDFDHIITNPNFGVDELNLIKNKWLIY